MKLLTFAVPCYNSAEYMEKCVKSLLVGGDDVEIIIVDDGSNKDNTAEIADRLERENPGIVRAIHQENGGHGEAVNCGIRNATGKYFKVVDSDDRVAKGAYKKILETLRSFEADKKSVDMLISNYVYDKVGEKKKKVVQYHFVLPRNKVFSWDKIGHFKKGQYILMHSVIFRTAALRASGVELPKHTFYVDNLYVFEPLPFIKKMYYLDVNFYLYYIGREDQSVNEKVMISRVDQQLRVNNLMYDYYSNLGPKVNPKLKAYMYSYLEIISIISSILLILEGSPKSLKMKDELWKGFSDRDVNLYGKLRHGLLGRCVNINNEFGRKLCISVYHIAQKLFHFN